MNPNHNPNVSQLFAHGALQASDIRPKAATHSFNSTPIQRSFFRFFRFFSRNKK